MLLPLLLSMEFSLFVERSVLVIPLHSESFFQGLVCDEFLVARRALIVTANDPQAT